VLIVIGTSGMVQPAARIPAMAKQAGAYVIQINPTSSALDGDCSYSLIGTAGATLPRLLDSAFPKINGLLSL
jgi:NAD-dependent deacetylase